MIKKLYPFENRKNENTEQIAMVEEVKVQMIVTHKKYYFYIYNERRSQSLNIDMTSLCRRSYNKRDRAAI